MWREGCPAWRPLSDIEELKMIAEQAQAALELKLLGDTRRRRRGRAVSEERQGGADYDAFSAEIAALDKEGGGQAGDAAATDASTPAEPDADVADAPATPEDKEFEDDDGTWYVWDAALRKYVQRDAPPPQAGALDPSSHTLPRGAPPAAPEYQLEDMVFGGVDEVTPTLEEVVAAEAAVLLEAEEAAARTKRGADASTSGSGPAGAKAAGKGKRAGGSSGGPGSAEGGSGSAADVAPDAAAAAAEPKAKKAKGKAAPTPQSQEWFELKINTSVYVTGLPLDTNETEVCAVFTKCGLVKVDEKGQPRIKLYRDKATGELKGDALVTYLKEPSVKLACDFLHDAPFRPEMGKRMTVAPAKFEKKDGEAPKPKAPTNKKVLKKQLELLERRALGWAGFDDKATKDKVTAVIKRMFTLDEVHDDPAIVGDLERDVMAECARLGPVEKVIVCRHNPEGVVLVQFKDPVHALACVTVMHGRWFGGRQLDAHMWDGFTKYNIKAKESAEEQAARLEKFSKELEDAVGGTATQDNEGFAH